METKKIRPFKLEKAALALNIGDEEAAKLAALAALDDPRVDRLTVHDETGLPALVLRDAWVGMSRGQGGGLARTLVELATNRRLGFLVAGTGVLEGEPVEVFEGIINGKPLLVLFLPEKGEVMASDGEVPPTNPLEQLGKGPSEGNQHFLDLLAKSIQKLHDIEQRAAETRHPLARTLFTVKQPRGTFRVRFGDKADAAEVAELIRQIEASPDIQELALDESEGVPDLWIRVRPTSLTPVTGDPEEYFNPEALTYFPPWLLHLNRMVAKGKAAFTFNGQGEGEEGAVLSVALAVPEWGAVNYLLHLDDRDRIQSGIALDAKAGMRPLSAKELRDFVRPVPPPYIEDAQDKIQRLRPNAAVTGLLRGLGLPVREPRP